LPRIDLRKSCTLLTLIAFVTGITLVAVSACLTQIYGLPEGSFFAGLVVLAISVFVYRFETGTAKTIALLRKAMERAAGGDFNASVNPMTGGLGELADDFNRMASILRSTMVSKRLFEESEYKFRTLAETTVSGILIFRDGMIIYANPAAEHITGYSKDELARMDFWEIVLREDRPLARDIGQRGLGEGHVPYGTYEIRICSKKGEERWVDATAGNTTVDGKAAGMVTISDITERRRAENELNAERKRFRTLIERAPYGMAMIGQDRSFQYINPKFREMFGYEPEDIPDGSAWLRKAYPGQECRRQVMAAWINNAEAMMDGETKPATFITTCKDGTEKLINFRSMRLAMGGYLMTCEDVTDMVSAERALRESEAKYRNIIEKSLVGVYIIQDNRFKFVNQKFCDIHEATYEKIIGSHEVPFRVHPEDRELVLKNLQRRLEGEEESLEYEFRLVLNNGEVRTVKVIGTAASYQDRPAIIGTLLDISKEKVLERQLLQSQKLETVGRLAGGIAHDFNNVLNVILGNAQLAKHLLSPGDKVFNYCTSIETAVFRASDSVKQLLAFSRRQLLELKLVYMNDILKGFAKMVGRMLGENIDMKVIADEGLPPVKADVTQIDQILLNLAINARDSMPQGGQLLIEAHGAVLGEEYCRFNPDAAPGDYAVLSITDTGVGMDQETLSRIFEPFFSNRDLGTGLGLAVVYGIVKQHNGFINAYSEVGKGTTIKVYIPAAAKVIEEEEIGQPEKKASGETILVVEDEEPLRNIAVEVLHTFGYKVIAAANGEEAVDIFRERPDEIDCALIDVVMPKMGGRETYEAMKTIRPSVRALFMTGYSLNGIHTNFILDQGIDAIQKPYSFDLLKKKIREILDR
jgi:two-component system cell cycle sensor histidine kinase/response regulator CckA